MTRILRYTDGSTATSVSGSSPLAFGTAIARPTTRTGLYDAIANGLIAAGFTQHNLTTRDDVWTSTGESGAESVNFRTQLSGTSNFQFYIGLKIDGSNNLQGSVGGGGTGADRWTINADATFDFIMLATKDFFWFNARRTSDNVQFNAFSGNIERDNSINGNTMVLFSGASAGSNVVLDVTGYNPTILDYRPGDLVQIISQAAGDPAQAQTLVVQAVTTSSLTVQSLAANYSAGARVGAYPQPIVRFVSTDTEPNIGSSWTTNLITPVFAGVTSDITSSTGQTFTTVDLASGSLLTAQDGFGTGTTANKRTRRFTLRSLSLRTANDIFIGRVPGLYGYPGSMSFFPNDTGTYNRVTPNQRFLGARFSSTATQFWMFGKAP